MAVNLTPAQLAALQRIAGPLVLGNSGNGVGTYNDGSMMYRPQYDTSGPSGEAGFDQTHSLQSYYGSDANHQNVGDPVYNYDLNGNYTNTSAINPLNSGQLFLEGLATAISMGTLGPYMAAAGAAGEGAAGAAGAAGMAGDATAAGYGGLSAADAATMGGGASIGGGSALGTGLGAGTAATGLGAGTSTMGAGSADLAGTGATATGGGSMGAYTNAAADSQAANAALGLGPVTGATSPALAVGGGDWLSNLVSSVGGADSGYGKILTSLLGGALGSKGVQTSQTTQKTIDPRMVPYVYGDGTNPGILGYTQSLLGQQMAPGALQGYTDMQNVGRGLLNQPVASNGFSKFNGGR